MVNKKSNKVQMTKRIIRDMIESKKETKSVTLTSSYTDLAIGFVGSVSQIIVQGDNITQRAGDIIFPKELTFNYTLLSGVGSTNSFHRFIIFQDMFNTGVAPVVTDVLDTGVFNATYPVLYRQQRRFKILHDKIYGVVGAANSAATHIQRRIKMKGKIFYNGGTNLTVSNGPGSIWFLAITDSVTVSTATASLFINLQFTDA